MKFHGRLSNRGTISFLPLLTLLTAFLPSVAAIPSFRSTLSQRSRLITNKQEVLSGIRSYNDSDFILGALIPVHRSAVDSSGSRCGDQLTDYGVQRVEEFLYLLDRINSDNDLLPNLTLGYDIRDTCLSSSVALGESLDLLVSDAGDELTICSVSSVTDSQPFFF